MGEKVINSRELCLRDLEIRFRRIVLQESQALSNFFLMRVRLVHEQHFGPLELQQLRFLLYFGLGRCTVGCQVFEQASHKLVFVVQVIQHVGEGQHLHLLFFLLHFFFLLFFFRFFLLFLFFIVIVKVSIVVDVLLSPLSKLVVGVIVSHIAVHSNGTMTRLVQSTSSSLR